MDVENNNDGISDDHKEIVDKCTVYINKFCLNKRRKRWMYKPEILDV